MLIDILNSENYIMINREAVNVLGLTTAVYCSELLNIYKKAVKKNKIYDEVYFKVDREYIKKETSISIEEQLKCDINLQQVSVIDISEKDVNMINFNVEVYASLLASEDIKLLSNVSEKVNKKSSKETKQAKRDYQITALKNAIRCNNYEILIALKDWIDSVMSDPTKNLSTQQVTLFKGKLDEYCRGDIRKALDVIQVATIHNYVDCGWAINTYEKDNQIKVQSFAKNNIIGTPGAQKITTNLGNEVF